MLFRRRGLGGGGRGATCRYLACRAAGTLHVAGQQATEVGRQQQWRRSDIWSFITRRAAQRQLSGYSREGIDSWYSSSVFTAQTSWRSPRTFFTASRAVSMAWSWLLYLCRPLRPTIWRFSNRTR